VGEIDKSGDKIRMRSCGEDVMNIDSEKVAGYRSFYGMSKMNCCTNQS
jgi:hypothetical protein